MIREWYSKDIAVIHYRHPWFQRKYDFADRLAKDWQLELHTEYAPVGMSLIQSETMGAEIVNHYPIGKTTLMLIMGKQGIGLREKWLCARHDILSRPSGTASFPWDVALCGHKGSDVDLALGSLPVRVDIHQMPNSADLAFPLRHFTDAEVWECIEKWNVPYDKLRYAKQGDGTYQDDTESIFNADHQPYCADCLDCTKGAAVTCPKTGVEVTNISRELLRVEKHHLNYIGGQ